MPIAWRPACVLLALCVLAAPVAAQIYTWTDAHGRVHMTDDLSAVPPEQRAEVEKRSRDKIEKPREWNNASVPRALPATPARRLRRSSGPGRVHRLKVDAAGREMRVWADLDGTRAPFIVDTGAMGCTVPAWVVREMGIEITAETPHIYVVGISGEAMRVPVITVGSVSVGDAEVENVEMAVLSTQNTGLLGMTFFNHFKVSTDPARGILTLEEIDLNAVEGVYGGLGEKAWRSKFRYVNGMLEHVQQMRERYPSQYSGVDEQIDEMETYWEGQLDELELKASRAGVPRAWRE